mgnify:CR=1 FL=1
MLAIIIILCIILSFIAMICCCADSLVEDEACSVDESLAETVTIDEAWLDECLAALKKKYKS